MMPAAVTLTAPMFAVLMLAAPTFAALVLAALMLDTVLLSAPILDNVIVMLRLCRSRACLRLGRDGLRTRRIHDSPGRTAPAADIGYLAEQPYDPE